MIRIKACSVGKKYDGRWALRKTSFDIEGGRIIAVIGPSGSGKSTLLRCINRLVDADAGAVSIDGKDIRTLDTPTLRRRVGMVFQFPSVFPGTVRDNLRYGMDLWGIDDEALMARALEDSGLDESYLERNTSKLSGGEQQRVCLARSLVIGSEALLLDEPTSSLDDESAGRIEKTFTELARRRGIAILWVTHDRDQASRVGDTVLELKSVSKAGPAPSKTRGGAEA